MAKYSVTFTKSNRTLEIDADEYILEAGMSAGLDLECGCLSGGCGVCMVKVEGEVDQSEGVAISPEEIEAGHALLCVGKPRSDLKIDA